jgi:rod shape determining protein RodA
LVLAVVSVLGASLTNLFFVSRAVGGSLFMRQCIFSLVGLALLWLLSLVHSSSWQRAAPILYGFGLALLVAVLLFGEVRSGTRGWFTVGPLSLQPSEFARTGTLLVLAAFVARHESRFLDLKSVVALFTLWGAPVALVLVEPDLGVALTYGPMLVVALWLGGLTARVWILLAVLTVAGATAAWFTILKPYQKERLLTVLEPDRDPYGAGYQVRQSRIAVGSGGIAGQGIGRGPQSVLRFLPAQHTDFAFGAWAESTGFIGATALLVSFALLLWRIAVTALATEDRFGLVVAMMVCSWLAFQATVNLGMVLGWLPTTGITLPLFSYGGSSLVSTCATLAVVESIWKDRLVNR